MEETGDCTEIRRALGGSQGDFHSLSGPHLFDRLNAFFAWRQERLRHALWGFESGEADRSGSGIQGLPSLDFASDDPLGLARHPHVLGAAQAALEEFGVLSGGAALPPGADRASQRLERELAGFLDTEHVALTPGGSCAGSHAIRALVGPQDHVVIDARVDPGLHDGAVQATGHLHRGTHRSADDARRVLARIRAKDTANAILVVTEGLHPLDSSAPDLRALREACLEFGAFLLVDVTNDLGWLGASGLGQLGEQDLVGRVDIVTGNLANSLASDGGFVATRSPAARAYLLGGAGSCTRFGSMPPVPAASACAALEIVRSGEGAGRRAALMNNILRLRNALRLRALDCIGIPSVHVPVMIGEEALGRLAARAAARQGARVELVEHPAVARRSARLVFRVAAHHTAAHTERLATILRQALDLALGEFERVGIETLPHACPGDVSP